MEQGNNISTGIGEGQAQVFRPNDLSYIDRAIAQQNYEKRYKHQEENQTSRRKSFNKKLQISQKKYMIGLRAVMQPKL